MIPVYPQIQTLGRVGTWICERGRRISASDFWPMFLTKISFFAKMAVITRGLLSTAITLAASLAVGLIMASRLNGMNVMNMFWQLTIRSLALVLAVYIDVVSKKK